MLRKSEGHQATKVLRLKPGDALIVTDGFGKAAVSNIQSITKNSVFVIPHYMLESNSACQSKLHIAISLLKNTERLEWFVEKAVELAIDRITPLHCQHTVKTNLRTDRLQSIIDSACKQSQRDRFPTLSPLTKFENFISEKTNDTKLIACCLDAKPKFALNKVLPANTNTTVVIGPEGDFSQMEVELAQKHNFVAASFGDARMRTETAGLFAAAYFYSINCF
ncbi:MAG: 16S rRNA (uracil(1498)-N(3))-methyltransferase [Bacteroidetes bacterium]|nr:16S rRNA (uracil(1498)-N(3))-methyltransferase [Bacteroidota bacterium]